MKSETAGAPPCFFSAVCGNRSAVAKCGKSVCRECAARMSGSEFPLSSGRNVSERDAIPNDWMWQFGGAREHHYHKRQAR